mmetsp:Transcript_27084/g.39875  ORF Transcript_27084/g.39875 Transcript_27084/m.39875 type:complete len:82 (+) Transcript_27084:1805-2050(+)
MGPHYVKRTKAAHHVLLLHCKFLLLILLLLDPLKEDGEDREADGEEIVDEEVYTEGTDDGMLDNKDADSEKDEKMRLTPMV